MSHEPFGSAKDIAIFISSFGDGGVDRMLVNLANGLVEAGNGVQFVVKQSRGVYEEHLSPGVSKVVLQGQTDKQLADELTAHLGRVRPAIVMSGKGADDRIALMAKARLKDPEIRFFLRVGTSLSSREAHKRPNLLRRWLLRRQTRRLFARCDGVIANSDGAVGELLDFLGFQPRHVAVAPNPTVTPDLLPLSGKPSPHPWLRDPEVPLVLGIGRLCRAKDFPTLLRAFAQLRERRSCRLMILGKGRQAGKLLSLAAELGIQDDFALPGFVQNPYAYLSKAKLFVLSSLWEGCPNVLIEALAVGTPSVSTDCPSGPREILGEGQYGRLVPPADVEALAQAMAATLDDPPQPEFLRQAVRAYTVENSCRAYLRAFGLG
jgi:glycosyltransferase involved in cell wall biosynthesis